jgi:phosphoribosylformylglycinamidine synthase
MAGRLGMEIDLDKIPCENCSALEAWFSESNSRFIATVPEKNREAFGAIFAGVPCAAIGKVTGSTTLKVTGRGAGCELELDALLNNYKKTLDRI